MSEEQRGHERRASVHDFVAHRGKPLDPTTARRQSHPAPTPPNRFQMMGTGLASAIGTRWATGISAVWHSVRHFTGTSTAAPLSLTMTTKNFAGMVLLAFRPTT